MISRWRRYNIFISSTFKDMDVERDVIKFEVIPDLNRRFRPKGVELQAIDLRLGVNTEGMDENASAGKVLKVCARGIDSSRPFFIGLVGSRYGWIPPFGRWEEFLRGLPRGERKMMEETFGASVTELEMIYGALNEKSLAESHILFYLRDESSYDGMPESMKGVYVDTDPVLRDKLSSLRDKIRERISSGGEDDSCTCYRLQYDPENGSFRTDDFKDLLIRQISGQIEQELNSERENLSLWEEEKKAVEARFSAMESALEPLSFYDSSLSDVVLVSGKGGAGLSSELAWLYSGMSRDKDRICLCTIAGSSANSLSERTVLALWCRELADMLGEECPREEELLDEASHSLADICTLYKSLAGKAAEKGKTVTLFIDDLQGFNGYHGAVADVLNRSQQAIVCCHGKEYESFVRYNPHLQVLHRDKALTKGDIDRLRGHFQNEYFLELPSGIGAGRLEGFSPLEIRMLFNLMESLDSGDFHRIRESGDNQIKAINEYLEGIWAELRRFAGTEGLFGWALGKMTGNLKLSSRWKDVFELIYLSPVGLRQTDLENLFSDFWDESDFFRLCSLLPEFVHEDTGRHIWTCSADPGIGAEQKSELMARAAVYLASLPKDDQMSVSLLAYFVVLSGDASLAGLLVFDNEDFVKSQVYAAYFRLPAEQFLNKKRGEYLDYVRKLPQNLALHYIYGIQRTLRKKSGNEGFVRELADILMEFDPDIMDARENLVTGSMLCGFEVLERRCYMERALETLQRAAELGIPADYNGNVGILYLLNKLCNLCRKEGDKAGQELYSGMLKDYSERAGHAGSDTEFNATVFQELTAAQMALKNELDAELSAGKGLKALFGGKKKRNDGRIAEIARKMTDMADDMFRRWEIDNNTVRLVYLYYFAYSNAVSAYALIGRDKEAFRAAFRLLMNLRGATYGSLDVKASLSLVLNAHVMLLSMACTPGVCGNEDLVMSILESTAAVVNRMSRIDPKDAGLVNLYRRFAGVSMLNSYIAVAKESDPDIVELGYRIEELGESEGMEWKLDG